MLVDHNYPIQPRHIKLPPLGICITGVFGKREDEDAAEVFIRAAQATGNWRRISGPVLLRFVRRQSSVVETVTRLIERKLICMSDDGTYRATHELISRVFVKYPNQSVGATTAQPSHRD